MDERIKSLLLSWNEYNEKEFSVPYIYSIKKNKQELIYFGSRHCYNPKDHEFEIIRKEWLDFYDRNKDREMIVVVEGGVRLIEQTEEGAIIKGGEMAFITFIASKQGVSTTCFEPYRGEIFNGIAKKYGEEKVFYQRMAQVILQWNTLTQKPPFEVYIEHFMERDKKESGWGNFNFSLENLKRIHNDIFNTDFNQSNRDFFYNIIDPSQNSTVINEISRYEDTIRDTVVIKGILEEWQKGKSIFVIYGLANSVIQERER